MRNKQHSRAPKISQIIKASQVNRENLIESSEIAGEEILFSPIKADFRSVEYQQPNSQMNQYSTDAAFPLSKRATQLSDKD